MKRKISIYTILLVSFSLLGCLPKIKQSGFLQSYDNLEESGTGRMLSYISPNFERGKYRKFIINDVVVMFSEEGRGKEVDKEKLDELTKFFKEEIIKNLEPEYSVVDEPGEDVARMQIAITEVTPGRVFANIFPISAAINSASGRAKGGAGIEMRVVDSQTNELLGQAMDNRKDRGYLKSFSRMGNTRAVLTYWAELLRERIDHYANAL